MKIQKYIGFTMMAVALHTATSCSDWKDWNDVQSDSNMAATQTLWENIAEKPELANFKQILEHTGMQELFSANKYYTVWAPTLTSAQRDSILNLDSAVIVDQFINNHIAEYNHQATGILAERIHTLNEKSYNFSGENGIYQFNDVNIVEKNIPSTNGTIHILQGKSPFLPNAYQNIWMVSNMDSIANYFKKYELTRLDESKSVAGPMVNGKQTYIDSVMITYNSMSNAINAKLDSEDSLYTFIMPNDEAYNKLYKKIASLYTYVDGTKAQDVANSTSATSYTLLTAPSIDMSYLKDSLIRRQIVNHLVYSHNDKYNAKFFDGIPYTYKGVGEPEDTIYSTYRGKFSEPDKILDPAHITETIKLSNGRAVVVDSLMFKPWETFNVQRTVSGLNPCRVLRANTSYIVLYNLDGSPLYIDGDIVTYLRAEPQSSSGKPEVDYYLRNVLSGTYRFYAVVAPGEAGDSTTTPKPNWLNFTLNYYNPQKGNVADYEFKNSNFVSGSEIITYSERESDKGKEVRTAIKDVDFFNDVNKIDTLYLGEFTFPCCYVGIGDYSPNIKIKSSDSFSTLSSRGHTAAFDRTIRIASIILRPVEYDDYLKKDEE
ncbi:MAG: fasciclin domain-containing protein [Bacteroidaceae bacterium]|nr:fasciclin domain-containing protein [Bacteroidaceae bacterium]